jgi:WD40 repeat protein
VQRRPGETAVPTYTVYHASHNHGQLIALSPDDTTLAVVCEYRRSHGVTLFDMATGTEQRRLIVREQGLSCVAFAPDGLAVAAGDQSGNLYLWESQTGKQLHAIPAHAAAIRTMIFLPGGKELATADEDGVIRLWNPSTGKEVRPRDGCLSPIRSLSVPADGKTIFTGSQETFVRRWDPATGKELGRVEGIGSHTYDISCSPNGKTLVVVDHDNNIALWDAASGKEIRRWESGREHSATQITFAPDGKTLASAGWDGRVWLWDPATGMEMRRMKSNNLIYTQDQHLTFSADGKLIASSNHRVGARVWDAATGQARLVIDPGKPSVEALAFSPNGSMLAVACDDGRVRVYGTIADKTIKAPDDLRLAGDNSGVVEVGTPKELRQLNVTGRRANAVAFSPDSRLLAAGGTDGIVRLWDTATWKERGVLRGHKGAITALAFLSNERLVSASADTTALVWDVSAPR